MATFCEAAAASKRGTTSLMGKALLCVKVYQSSFGASVMTDSIKNG